MHNIQIESKLKKVKFFHKKMFNNQPLMHNVQ